MKIPPLAKSIAFTGIAGFLSLSFLPSSIASASPVTPIEPTKLNKCTLQNQQDNRGCGNKTDAIQKDQCLKTATEKYRLCLEKP